MSRRLMSCALAALCLLAATHAASGRTRTRAAAAPSPREVKVYLVALDDGGKSGRKIGCGDSLVAVTRTINAGGSPLRSAVRELLLIPRDYDARLKNFWAGGSLRVRGVTISRAGVATINLAGEGPPVAGVCDEPRIISQIEETAKQFPNVRRVRVFVNGRALARVIR